MNSILEKHECVKLYSHDTFRDLVKSHHEMLIRVAQSIVDEDLAEEVVQEAWISIYKNIDNFQGQSSLKTWMCRVTVNQAISQKRKKNAPTESSIMSEHQEADFYKRFGKNGVWNKPIKNWHENSPEKILYSQELQQCIEDIMTNLPIKQRICFYLSHFENEDNKSIGIILDESQANIKVLIHRARIKLFEHVTNFQESGEC